MAAPSTESVLSGITCRHTSSCWAVGLHGTNPSSAGTLAERWSTHHHGWRHVHSPNPSGRAESSFNGVSCGATSSCMAVGAAETAPPSLQVSGLTEHWNGRHWTIKPLPHPKRYPSSNLWAVSCPTRHLCLAVGSYLTNRSADDTDVLIEKWNGSAWSVLTSPGTFDSSVLFGVSCASATSCLAVGDYVDSDIGHPLTEQWNGATWSLMTPRDTINSQSLELDGVSCTDPTDCVAVGRYDENTPSSLERTLAEFWTAPVTTVLDAPRNTSSTRADELWSDSCTSLTHCLAAGQAETNTSGTHMKTLVERWNGSAWKTITTPAVGTSASFRFLAIGCVTASDCFAVGDNVKSVHDTVTLAEHWDGHHWHKVSSQNS